LGKIILYNVQGPVLLIQQWTLVQLSEKKLLFSYCCLTNGDRYPVCNMQYAHRAKVPVYFMSAQRRVLGGNATKLAQLVTIT